MNQHLIRSVKAIRAQGGVTLKSGDTVMPEPILIGRNARKVIFTDTGHAPSIERPSRFDALLAEFLAGELVGGSGDAAEGVEAVSA
jgi:hypothetical protein